MDFIVVGLSMNSKTRVVSGFKLSPSTLRVKIPSVQYPLYHHFGLPEVNRFYFLS